jgi:hypothetical protein
MGLIDLLPGDNELVIPKDLAVRPSPSSPASPRSGDDGEDRAIFRANISENTKVDRREQIRCSSFPRCPICFSFACTDQVTWPTKSARCAGSKESAKAAGITTNQRTKQ